MSRPSGRLIGQWMNCFADLFQTGPRGLVVKQEWSRGIGQIATSGHMTCLRVASLEAPPSWAELSEDYGQRRAENCSFISHTHGLTDFSALQR